MKIKNNVRNLSSNTKSKLIRVLPYIKTATVEPAAFLLMTAVLMSYLITQDLIIERTCHVNLNYTKEECKEVVKIPENHKEKEKEIQMIAAQIRTNRSIIDHFIPIFLVIFLGRWSDSNGRKFLMLLPIFGFVLQSIALIICTNIETIDGYWLGYIASITRSVCGGELLYSMAAYSYIADRTVKSSRTIRIGLLSAGYQLGVPFGFALGGIVSKSNLGYSSSFAISGAIALFAFFTILFGVDNKVKVNETEVGEIRDKNNEKGCMEKVSYMKDTVKDYFDVPFKKRKDFDRLKILFLIIGFSCTIAPIFGEFGIMYLFVRERLQWDAGDFGYFSTYRTLVGILGVILSMGILSYGLNLSDALVGFISGISQFGGCIVYALASSTFLMYLAPAIDCMNGTMVVIARSMLSKLVEPSEVGKLYSLLAILEVAIPLGMDPLYSTLYGKTIDTFAGYVFVLSAALTIPPQAVFMGLIWTQRKSKSVNLEHVESKYTSTINTNEKTEEFRGVFNQTFLP